MAYVSAQTRREEFDAEAAYADSETVGDCVGSVSEQIDFGKFLTLAVTGAKVGSRSKNPYVTAGATVVGAAFGIVSSITGDSPKGAGEANAKKIGAAAAEWQQAGADIDDERAEWLGSSLGVALQIAAEQSNGDAVSSIQHIDP